MHKRIGQSRFGGYLRLFCRYTGLFAGYVGLFCGYTGLFCEYTENYVTNNMLAVQGFVDI